MTRRDYTGSNITVTFDAEVCQHAGECVRGLPAVFNVSARPWIAADAAPAEAVAEVIGRCPSGALAYQLVPGGPPTP
jgi:uncharacterized Fe-S cluster protein YjdI